MSANTMAAKAFTTHQLKSPLLREQVAGQINVEKINQESI